jgi:hypothetical protein
MDDSRLCAAVDPRRCLQSHEGPAVKLKIEKGSANSWIQVNRFGPLVGLVGRRGGRVIIDNYNRLSLCGYRNKLSNLLQWDRFDEDLNIINVRLRSTPPPQSPRSTKVSKHCGAPLSTFLSMAGEQLGYVEGYRFLQNPKVLIMNILRISISALWRRYSWFESMRGRFRFAKSSGHAFRVSFVHAW